MKNLCLLSLGIFLSACSTFTLQPTPAMTLPKANKTSIFYYSVNPENNAQAMGLLHGKFAWKDGCIYLVNEKGEYSTAMFPMYPKSENHWEESTKTITLHGIAFKMGDSIVTNGNYDTYVPNVGRFIEYEQQGDKKCLNHSLAYIGTLSIEVK